MSEVRLSPEILAHYAGRYTFSPELQMEVTQSDGRIMIALPSSYPYQIGFAMLAGRIAKLPP